MEESSCKAARTETSEVLCFGFLPLFLKSGTFPIVLDFNRVRTISTPLKVSYPLFSGHGFIEPEDFGAGKICGIL